VLVICVADKHNGVVKGLHIVGGIVRLGKNNRSFNLIHTGHDTFSKYICVCPLSVVFPI